MSVKTIATTAADVIPPSKHNSLHHITVRAKAVERTDEPGVFQIAFECTELSAATRELLHDLFPNTVEQVYRLLDVEVLIDNIVR